MSVINNIQVKSHKTTFSKPGTFLIKMHNSIKINIFVTEKQIDMKKLYTFLIIVCTVFTVNAQTPTTWDGTGWDNGDPQFDIDAIINGNLTLEYDLDTKNLTIASGVTLTLPEGTTLSVFGDVVNNGSIIVESDANFIQKVQASNYSGSGTDTVKRVAKLKKNDFNYFCTDSFG